MCCAASQNERTEIEKVLRVATEERVLEWTKLQMAVTTGLLFVQGERYDEPRYRWLPRQFFSEPLDDDGCAHRGEKGGELVLCKSGFVLDAVTEKAALLERRKFVISGTEGSPCCWSSCCIRCRTRCLKLATSKDMDLASWPSY